MVIDSSPQCPPDGYRKFDRMQGRQSVVEEYASDRGTQGLESDAFVFFVILYLAELSGLCNAMSGHEAECAVFGYAEHENGSFPTLSGMRLHVPEQMSGQCDGVVRRIGHHIITE